MTLKIVIKSQKEKKVGERAIKTTQNKRQNGSKNIHINNCLKFKWTKCSNQNRIAKWKQKQDLFICCL